MTTTDLEVERMGKCDARTEILAYLLLVPTKAAFLVDSAEE
jgi:hypothetical protein